MFGCYVTLYFFGHCFPVIFLCPDGVTPLSGLYRYVQPQRVWFFRHFGHKYGIINSVWLHSSLELGESYSFITIDKTIKRSPSQIMLTAY